MIFESSLKQRFSLFKICLPPPTRIYNIEEKKKDFTVFFKFLKQAGGRLRHFPVLIKGDKLEGVYLKGEAFSPHFQVANCIFQKERQTENM